MVCAALAFSGAFCSLYIILVVCCVILVFTDPNLKSHLLKEYTTHSCNWVKEHFSWIAVSSQSYNTWMGA